MNDWASLCNFEINRNPLDGFAINMQGNSPNWQVAESMSISQLALQEEGLVRHRRVQWKSIRTQKPAIKPGNPKEMSPLPDTTDIRRYPKVVQNLATLASPGNSILCALLKIWECCYIRT